MNTMQIRMELERLVPAKVNCDVAEIVKNIFKSVFPSKGEMLRMIEWGEHQTKDRKVKLVIEEFGRQQHQASNEERVGANGQIA
jgi:hypothetical protein